jgi:glycine cleavage system H protein
MSETKVLDGYYYTEKHEWIKVDGKNAFLGITDFAQNALGDLVYIDLPAKGKKVTKANSCGTLESVKAAEDVYSPITGDVLERNEAVIKDPSLVNQDAYSHWMLHLENISMEDLGSLMDANKYKEYLKGLG